MTALRVIPIVLLFAATQAWGGVITLLASARVAGDGPVLVRDIASVDGEHAEDLADAVVLERPADRAAGRAWFELGVDELRRALEARKVNWGRVSLRGSTCVVRLTGASQRDGASTPRERLTPRTHETVDVSGPETVRTRIVTLLGRLYGAAPNELRVLFDESDEAFLSMSGLGRRIEVQPAATASSSRFAVIVWIYEGDRMIEHRTLRVDLRIRKQVVTLVGELRRGERITRDHLREDRMWIEPVGAATLDSIKDAAGQVARRRLSPGEILRTDHLESPIVIQRGSLVTVHCISGAIVVKAKARAQASARADEMVRLTLEGSDKSFQARVAGPGRAIMNLDHAHAPDESNE